MSAGSAGTPKSGVAAALADLGARQWQIEIVAPILELALLETSPLIEPTADPAEGSEAVETSES